MAKLQIKFQIPADEVQDFLNGLGCSVDTLRSDLSLHLEPHPGSENLIDGTTAIHATYPKPEEIYDELASHFFRASLDNDRIILKFASGLEVLEHMTAEAAAYNVMKDLQGNVIPMFKGIHSVVGDPHTMCLITSDVGNSIPAGGLLHLPEDDRLRIAHLFAVPTCEKKIALADLDECHILYDAEAHRYWLHDFHNTYRHTCEEPRTGEGVEDPIIGEFPCAFLRQELISLALWK